MGALGGEIKMNIFPLGLSLNLEAEEERCGVGRGGRANDFEMRSRVALRPAGQDSSPGQGARYAASH
jgi:hypothetical protein